MKKILFLSLLAFIFAANVNAQVSIGSQDPPVEGAVLELKSGNLGFLPSRVELVKLSQAAPLPNHVQGMVVFNTKELPADTLHVGLYYNTGQKWIRFQASNTETWFYMPSILFDTQSPTGTYPFAGEVNLYNAFYKQKRDKSNNKVVASSGAPASALNFVPGADGYYYYVTEFDEEVFDIKEISASGVMKYEIKALASEKTFINIVFVEKF